MDDDLEKKLRDFLEGEATKRASRQGAKTALLWSLAMIGGATLLFGVLFIVTHIQVR